MKELRVIQKEESLDQLLYEGDLTALLIIEDIRPNDLLEYSYSISNFYPANQPAAYSLSLQSNHRWEKYYRRIVKEPDRNYKIKHYPSDWNSYMREDASDFVWEIEPCPAYFHEEDQPPGYDSVASFDISEFTSWNDLARLETPHFRLDPSFAKDPEVVQLLRLWKNRFNSLEDQTLAALRFVQDEIRYFGLEDGYKGVTPSDPIATLKRRFGDCKGKTQLLRAFLQAMNIPSYACLVDSDSQKEIKNHIPCQLFNHVIICIDLNGQLIFADPTQTFQGGTLDQTYLPYGYGLIISEETQDLTSIPRPIVHPEIDCSTTFILDEMDMAVMQISVCFAGESANNWRCLINKYGSKNLSWLFQNQLQSQFGSFQSKIRSGSMTRGIKTISMQPYH